MSAAMPYPGLRPFAHDEADIFFGREQQTDQLLDRLARSRFLAVVGPSGCGKSSLVRAGLVAALETGLMAPAGARWSVVEMRPGNHPLQRLAEVLLDEPLVGAKRQGAEAGGLLQATLRRGPLGLAEALLESPLPPATNLLLLVDQFEEIFRYRKEGDQDEADAFVALLLESALQRQVDIYVVITMRSDFLGQCSIFTDLPEALNDNSYLTPRLTRLQRSAAIVGPARVYGGDVEPLLVNRLLNDMGADPDQLPLMQHALMRMWARPRRAPALQPAAQAPAPVLTLADYKAVGGLAKALDKHADDAYLELPEEGRRVAEVLFRCLSDGDVRRPLSLAKIAAVAEAPVGAVIDVVKVFRRSDRSFLTPPAGEPLGPHSVIDITHESLIRGWTRLSGWAQREQRAADTYRLLEPTARLWKAGQAALWGTPDLENALAWREEARPTAAWAERYGGNFELALEFLEASVDRRQQQEDAEAAARERDLRQARSLAEAQTERAEAERRRAEDQAKANRRLRRLSAALVVALLLAIVAAGLAWTKQREATESARQLRIAYTALEVAASGAKAAQARSEQEATRARRAEKTAKEALQTAQSERENAKSKAALAEQKAREAFEATRAAVAAKQAADEARHNAVAAKQTAEDEKAKAQSHGLVAAAMLNLDADPELSILLAMRALAAPAADHHSDAQAVQALHHAVQASRIEARISPGQGAISRLALGPATASSPAQIASAGADGTVRLLNRATRREEGPELKGGTSAVLAAAFSPDGEYLVTGDLSGKATLWDAVTGDSLRAFAAHEGPVLAAAFSPDGQRFATASQDHKVKLWLRNSEQPLHIYRGHAETVTAVAFSPDGERVATCGFDGEVIVWDAESGRRLIPRTAGFGEIWDLAFSPDGAWLAIAGERKARILAAATGRTLAELDAKGLVAGVAINPAGTRLATSGDAGVRLWNVEDLGAPVLVKELEASPVVKVAFSPDGSRLAGGTLAGEVKIWDVALLAAVRTLPGDGLPAWKVVFSPDGSRLLSTGLNGRAQLWNAASGEQLLALYGNPAPISGLAFASDGASVMIVGTEAIELRDRLTGKPLLSLSGQELKDLGASVTAATISPDRKRLIAVLSDGKVRTFPLAAGHKESGQLAATPAQHILAAFSQDGTRLATAGKDGTVRVWDAGTYRQLATWKATSGQADGIASFAFTAATDGLVIGHVSGDVGLWDVSTGKLLRSFAGHKNRIYALELSRDGRWLATVSADSTARVWDVSSGAQRLLLKGNDGPLTAIAFDMEREELVTGSRNGTMMLWDLSPSHERAVLAAHQKSVRRFAFSATGERLATASEDGTVKVWAWATRKLESSLDNQGTGLWDVNFSPDGSRVAAAAEDGAIRLWDLRSGQAVSLPAAHQEGARAVAFNRDGTLLATGGVDKEVQIWDVSSPGSPTQRATLSDYSTVDTVAFSPRGNLLATGNADGAVRLWDAVSRQEVSLLSGHEGRVNRVVWKSDGSQIATASDDHTAKLWSVAEGKELWTFRGHHDAVKSVAFSLDETRLVTASFDQTAKVLDVASGEELLTLTGSDRVRDATYNPDGTNVLTCGDDGSVRIYASGLADLETMARERVTRQLTDQECKIYLHSKCPAPSPEGLPAPRASARTTAP